VQIDLFTLAAQIVNFLVLLALLRYFLYDRVIEAMDEREKRIASRLEEAEETLEEAEEEKSSYRKKQEEWEDRRDRMLREAREEVAKRREGWLKEARGDVDAAKDQWMDELERQRTAFLGELRRRVGAEAIGVARRALADLANADLEQQVIDAFLEKLGDVGGEERSRMAAARSWSVVTGFELSDERRGALKDGLAGAIGEERPLDFSTSEEIVGGIRLRFDGAVVAWELSDYLDRVEQRVRDALRDANRSDRSRAEEALACDDELGEKEEGET